MMREVCDLIFDSKRAEGTCGSRSSVTADRSLSYRGKELSVDMVVCKGAGTLQVLHGQVIHDPTGEPISVASVHLGNAERAVLTDEHGQFAVSSVEPHDMQFLWIDAPNQQLLCPIPPLSGKQ